MGRANLTARSATGYVERANAHAQIDLQIAMSLPQGSNCRSDDLMSERLGRGHANQARHERITSCGNAFEIQRSIFHRYALAQNGVSGRRHSKAIRRSVQQCHPQAFLELRDVPPDRHMTDAQRTSSTRQAARARHRKKEAHIVPLPESTRWSVHI